VYKFVTGRAQTALKIYPGSANNIKRDKLDCENVNFVSLVQDKDYSVRRTLMKTVRDFVNLIVFRYVNCIQLLYK
jgi:hypothetical protein